MSYQSSFIYPSFIKFPVVDCAPVQGQNGSTTTRAFIFFAKFAEFYYHKIFETRSWWQTECCMDVRSPCGLSITGDIKICQCHMIKRWLWASDITTASGRAPNGTLSVIFTCCSNLMFLASCGCRYIDFQTGHFAGFEQFKVGIHSANFGQVEGEPIRSLLWTVDRSQFSY